MTGRTELHICHGNVTGLCHRDNVIEPIVVPYASRLGNAFLFEYDDARAHRARVTQDHPLFRRITTPPWPAKSPDLSPTERLWNILGRPVRRRPHKPQDVNELADALQEEGRRIPQETTGRLIRSMRRRCLVCLAASGDPTRY